MLTAALNNILNEFTLNESQLTAHNAYVDYFSIMIQAQQNHTPITKLPEEQLNTLFMLASEDEHAPGVMARDLLVANNLLNYIAPIKLPDPGLKSGKEAYSNTDYTTIGKDVNSLKVFPNPTQDFVIVEYKLHKEGQAVLTLTNMQGTTMQSKVLQQNQDQQTLRLENINPGTYVVSINQNGRIIFSKTITIQ